MRLPPLEGRSMTSRKRVKSLRVGRRLHPPPMSALGQKQTCAVQRAMSALPPIATAKADFRKRSCPLYPRKRTCALHLGMSAMGQ